MNTARLATLALFTLATLVACPKPPPEVALEYRISAVQPAPVTPGDTATLYGVLPSGGTLTVDGAAVTGAPVTDGIAFRVPERATAGELEVRLTAGKVVLTGTVSVVPRLDRLSVVGDALRLEGAGWGDKAGVTAVVNGLERPATRDGSALRVDGVTGGAFGSFTATVRVAERTSNALTVAREAGALEGTVVLPGAGVAAERVRPMALEAAPPSGSLLADTDPGVVPGALETRAIPALGVWRVRFADAATAARALETLRSRGVPARFEEIVRPADGVRALDADPPSSPGAGQWYLPRMGITPGAAGATGAGVTVAVVDMGVRLDHPDLRANLLPGYDFVDGDNDPSPTSSAEGHGTHVAGLIAANGKARGVAPGARLVPVRALNAGGGSESAVALGILWAAGVLDGQPNPNPARVVNLSLGAGAYSEVIATAVSRAQAAGVIVVAAAGNDGSATVSYPAALPGVIAVTALAGPITPYAPFYASHGPGTWLTAYGGDTTADQDNDRVPDGILSSDNTPSGYGLRMGTSMACPQVAGLAALALETGTPVRGLRDTLARTAVDLGAWGFDTRYGWGLAHARSSRPSTPRTYALAVVGKTVKAWTLVQPDGTYRMDGLEPGVTYRVLAASDANGDLVLGQAGEWVSPALETTARSRSVQALEPLTLQAASGAALYTLEVLR